MSSSSEKKQPTKYEGWREPKIAVSFCNHSHVYYGVVWIVIVTFLFFSTS